MVAANVMRGDHPVEHWDSVDWPAVRADPAAVIVDVREVSAMQMPSNMAAVALGCLLKSVAMLQLLQLLLQAEYAA
jgi:hypothetical protein